MRRAGLLLIDLQNDYFKGGRFELCGAEAAAEQAARILSFFRNKGLPIFHIRHISLRENATFFLPGTTGAEFYEAVRPKDGETIVIKHAPDSFFQTDLFKRLKEKQVKKLVVCGMMTHMCVDSTVRGAKNHGYETALIADACATRPLQWNGVTVPADAVQNAFFAALHGTFADVTDAETLQNCFDTIMGF